MLLPSVFCCSSLVVLMGFLFSHYTENSEAWYYLVKLGEQSTVASTAVALAA